MWAAICDGFICEILNLNQSATVFTCESFHLVSVAVCVTTSTCHAHEPLGLQFIEKTLS